MSTGRKLKRSSDSICPMEEKWSAHQLTASGLKAVGVSPRTSPDSALFVIRICQHCHSTFGIRASKLKNPTLGRFCSRPCSVRTWVASQPKERFQQYAKGGLAAWQAKNRSWNKGIPMRESTREKLSTLMKQKGDPFATGRGGNGTGMSRCERLLSEVLAPGWVWNLPISTKVLTQRGWTGLPSNYKPDFAWPERMTCLEVDGASHNTKLGKERGAKKEKALAALGWIVLRISNAEILSKYGTSRSKKPTTTSQVTV